MKLAGYLIAWWYQHDLDAIATLCEHWRPGHILERLKFETAAKLLAFLAIVNGYHPDDAEFVTEALKAARRGPNRHARQLYSRDISTSDADGDS